jgi:hypothetical protein
MLIEREGRQLPLDTEDGSNAFYANLEDYVRVLQRHGAKIYLVAGVPNHGRFNPSAMVTRNLTSLRVAPDAGATVPIAALRSAHAKTDAKLRMVAEHTGATLLDPVSDICGDSKDCSPFFGAGEPKFSDGTHLRPVFVRDHLLFLDFLLK